MTVSVRAAGRAAVENPSPRVRFGHGELGLRATIAWPGAPRVLADVCAMFESFGLRVAAHHELTGETETVHAFEFDTGPEALPPSVAPACAAAAAGRWRADRYARLITTAGIDWRETVLLRAACRFLKQTRWGYSETYVVDSLTRSPEFVRAIIALFRARFDPAGGGDEPAALAEVDALVEGADLLDDDRIRRALRAFVLATVRTNWFQVDTDGQARPRLAFKIDSSRLATPGPWVPYREIFVHSEEVEGIHMRAGAVARGGLRWSDRTEDFRTEVLDLVKTQTVKNAPIVPTGAKGAFVIRDAALEPADGYRVFVRGLLDLTDTIVDGEVRHPEHTVCHDGPDPYLVVAADKGTARFSDLANSLAAEYDFWLGDAFASGGSAGYDHKAMGITARGAWVSVRRHFAEAGRDIDAEPFTVAGIGDMSGDVFGNGMLLSRNIELVAAFDHRHVFLDPDPDPESSYAERRRLFELPRSSWADYDSALISDGGGVWPRTAKSIRLSQRARARLGIEQSSCTPDELIRAILCAPVDLLWNGGIGTYVRADHETDVDAQDPANDRVRVPASRLRCAVVGEGGNLGFTQHARIGYALRGGRINADFIDNAAGVATSDLEVNLKIALDSGVRAGALSADKRNALLAEVTDDVAARVLERSDNQVLAIGLAADRAKYLLERHIRLIANLRDEAGMDPGVAGLPSDAELHRRTQAGEGLTRPEIAVLLAHSKNLVSRELLDSTLPDDPAFAPRLRDYFPDAVTAHAADLIDAHPLRREIIATTVADELINRIGPGTIFRLQERLGVSTADVARAYETVRGVLDLDALWTDCRNRPGAESQRIQALFDLRELVEHLISWVLRSSRGETGSDLDRFTDSVRRLVTAGKESR
ncbi:NAD-glutamate dehydrogenase [Nocardia yamanashiensis]|uniref:NAD-glutamate dehydrogenase domain-containing protein n=1 Tax=Nocardia yamanashiensis TaxID=209247 RepID=UPI001E2E1409|nr:NAD-glutamate dehydrogenase domain-containing protein [Nocardia yamanashiensis]UGT44976.1 NAD-glutamate dehydrogenase [Nocardia yamanashiensis]